jgi:hypothetical protein
VTVIRAAGTLAPLVSCTIPVIWDVVDCAHAEQTPNNANATERNSRELMDGSPLRKASYQNTQGFDREVEC